MVKFITKTVLALAFFGLSASAFAQSTYIITGSGTTFTVYKDGTPLLANQPIQSVIDAVKMNANGADCIIQFENSGNTLNTGADNITFDGGANGTAWGLITLTGKLTSTGDAMNNGAVCLKNGASVNSKADITSTATNMAIAIYHNSAGTLTISEGTLKTTSGLSYTIQANGGGAINITGGTIAATGTNGRAIEAYSYIGNVGKITISGDAVVTSKNNVPAQATIAISELMPSTGVALEITGGTVENTATDGDGNTINHSGSTVEISGGTVSAIIGKAIRNYSGTVNISGGTVSATTGSAVRNEGANGKIIVSGTGKVTSAGNATIHLEKGGIEISGGTVENTATTGMGVALFSDDDGTITIGGGTISATTGNAVRDDNAGTIIITGGTISATTNAALFSNFGTVTISGGTLSATSGTAAYSDSGEMTITGGTLSATEGTAAYNAYGQLTISGGTLSAISGNAIFNLEGTTTFSGGIAFAYGTSKADVIEGDCAMSGDAVVVAWDAAAGNTDYVANTDDDIFKDPGAATAVWSKQGDESGIAVNYGATNGFVAIADVTVTGMPEIISLTISPETANVLPGGTQQFIATVVAVGGADESVTWSVDGQLSGLTTISTTGLLTVGSNEIAESLIVTVVSVFDPTFIAEAVIYTGSDPKVLSVTISPKTATIGEGKTQQFTVTVNAVNGADESVTWNLTGNYSTLTTVSATGLLTVGDNETATTLTVTVTSVFDPTVSDEATVTVGNVGIVETGRATSVQVYPNPTSGELRVTSYELQVTNVEIFDITGRLIQSSPASPSPETTLNISHLANGVYFLRITTENGVVTRKVVKQ